MKIVLFIISILVSIYFGAWRAVRGAEKKLLLEIDATDLPEDLKDRFTKIVLKSLNPYTYKEPEE